MSSFWSGCLQYPVFEGFEVVSPHPGLENMRQPHQSATDPHDDLHR
jgi:hypothetical protein